MSWPQIRKTTAFFLCAICAAVRLPAAAPAITLPPAARTVVPSGQSLTLSVNAIGDTALTYQWKKNGFPVAGATTRTFSATKLNLQDSGFYTVEVTDGNGQTSRAVAFVNVAPVSPQIVKWGSFTTSTPATLTNAVMLAAGGGFALALKSDGTVAAWGSGPAVTVPTGLGNVVAVAAGHNHALALKSDGTVTAWGTSSGSTALPSGLTNVVAVSAGLFYSLALKADGTVVAWGSNTSGQATVPTGLENVVAVSAGKGHSLALKADGTMVAWGHNSRGQATVQIGLKHVVAIAAGCSSSLALKADGTMQRWGLSGSWYAVPAGLNNLVAVATNYNDDNHVALKADGTVVAWGDSIGSGGHSAVPFGLTQVVAIADGAAFTLALRDTALSTTTPSVTRPLALTAIIGQTATFSAVARGGSLSYQWRKNGTPISGTNSLTLTLSNVQLSNSGSYTVMATNTMGSTVSQPAILTVIPPLTITTPPTQRTVLLPGQALDLTVEASGQAPLTYQWKKNGWPIPGATSASYHHDSVAHHDGGAYVVEVTDANGLVARGIAFVNVQIPAAQIVTWSDHSVSARSNTGSVLAVSGPLTLKADGTVTDEENPPDLPANLTNIVAISSGQYHRMALKADGTVVEWVGFSAVNYNGNSSGLADVIAIADGKNHALALKSDGTVAVWGSNDSQQSMLPPSLSGVQVAAIGAGGNGSFAVKSDGTLIVWGSAFSPPAGLTGVVAVAGADSHLLALKTDGTVVAWPGSSSVTTVPQGLGDVVAVAADYGYSLALKSDATVVAWGAPYYLAQLPDGLTNVRAIRAMGGVSTALRDASQDALPAIVTPPTTQTVLSGQTVTLSVAASGIFLSYQWCKNGVPIADTTSPELVLMNVQGADSGNYTVVVTNGAGNVTSSLAALTVVPPPQISSAPPARMVLVAGQPLTLSVAATGQGSLSYQWRRNGRLIPGATAASFSSPAVSGGDGGYYQVVVTDASTGLKSRAGGFVVVHLARPQVIGWGDNRHDQASVPLDVGNVVALAGGGSHSLALKADGTVVAWGGIAGSYIMSEAVVPAGLTDVVAIAGGYSHSLALRSDGTVVGWGSTNVPAGLADVMAVAAGGGFSLALKADGTVVAWGDGSLGQLSIPTDLADVVAIAVGWAHSLALKADGTVVAWSQTFVPSNMTNIVAVAAGGNRSLALKTDGTVVAWDSNGTLAVPDGLSDVASIAAGNDFLMAVKMDGTMVVWGSNFYQQTIVPAELSNVVSANAGAASNHVLVLRDGASDTMPTITTQPVDQTATTWQNVTYSVAATGNYLTYQWNKDGVPISGAKSSILAINGVQSSSQGSYTVVVTSGAGSIISQPATLTVPTSFAAWQTYFLPAQLADPSISGPNGFFGSSKTPNLLKYAFGVWPNADVPAGVQAISQSGSDWVFSYQRPADRVDLSYIVEVSADLQTWTTSGVVQQRLSNVGGLETWTARYQTAVPRQFFRLRVVLP